MHSHTKYAHRSLYGHRSYPEQDPVARTGLYEAEIVQAIVNKVFYKNPTDDGVIHDDRYRPFPIRGIALILTAVRQLTEFILLVMLLN